MANKKNPFPEDSGSLENQEFSDPENLFHLAQDQELTFQAKDLNTKISGLEQTLLDITLGLDSTNKSFRSALENVDSKNRTISNEVDQTNTQLRGLDSAFKMLQEQTAVLTAKAHQLSMDMDRNATISNSAIEAIGQELSIRNKALEQELDQAETAIESNTSSIHEMQSMEKELDRRSKVTESATKNLEKQTEKLDKRATKLETTADSLEQLGQNLLKAVTDVGVKAGDLKQEIEKQERRITALSLLEHRHFRFVGVSLIFILLAIGLMLSQQRNDTQISREADLALTQQMAQQIGIQTGLQVQQNEHAAKTQSISENIQAIEQQITKLDNRLQDVGDQAESVAGRISSINPHRNFGSDNIIHGPAWLKQQAENNYAILLATVSSKQELYQVTDHYASFLKHEVSYIEISGDSIKYVLIYGNFADRQQALSILNQLPMQAQRLNPSLVSISNILKL